MSLINSTYFVGPLSVAQLGQVSVQNDLQLCIDRNETDFLQAVLGIELYSDMISGLSQSIIDQRWLNLLSGTTFQSTTNFPGYLPMWIYRNWYMNTTRQVRWVGFAGTVPAPVSVTPISQLVLIVDSGANNPVSGTTSFTLASLSGAIFSIDRRGTGPLVLGLDYSLSNNNTTITLLLPGDFFGPSEVFILSFTNAPATLSLPSAVGQSPVAGYVYFKYMRDLISQTTGSGIVQDQPENATSGVGQRKMMDAWNQMGRDIANMWLYLASEGTGLYSDYDITKMDFFRFTPINMFNI